MTDQTTPANLTRKEAQTVREWAERAWSTKVQDAAVAHAARVLLAVLPPRPTLADMTNEERAACRWMQADVKPGGLSDVKTWGRCVIITPYDEDGDTGLISANGKIVWDSSERVTPRPDLPRLEWPGDTPTWPDHLAVGTIIESADDPRIAALPLGSILLDREGDTTTKRSAAWTGIGYAPDKGEGDTYGPWTVLHIPKEDDQ